MKFNLKANEHLTLQRNGTDLTNPDEPVSAGYLANTAYSRLKGLRDSAGRRYRITDHTCAATQTALSSDTIQNVKIA